MLLFKITVFHIVVLVNELIKDILTYDIVTPFKRPLPLVRPERSQLVDSAKDVIAEIFCDVEHLLYRKLELLRWISYWRVHVEDEGLWLNGVPLLLLQGIQVGRTADPLHASADLDLIFDAWTQILPRMREPAIRSSSCVCIFVAL